MARGAGAGLPTVSVPVYVGGALDTKSNPKLVQPGAALELENLVMLKTGEMRVRNGFAALSVSANPTQGLDNLFADPRGQLMAIASNWGGFGKVAVKYRAPGTGAATGWGVTAGTVTQFVFPTATASINGVEASSGAGFGSGSSDLVDPDLCVASGVSLTAWRENGGAELRVKFLLKELATGQPLQLTPSDVGFTQRPPVCVAGGSSYLCMLYLDTSATPSLKAMCRDSAGTVTSTPTIALNAVSAAQPWFDAKPIPGGNLIAVAYRASAGGVTCCILNPATGAITSTVTTAAADATMCLGWLDDSLATGSMYLATAGGTAGVVVRTMSATTMVVSATNVIDATATASVRQITGHLNTGAADYTVLWEVSAAPTYYSLIRRGVWTGSAAVADHAASFGLYSRSFLGSDGKYHVVASYDSTIQPSYSVIVAAATSNNVPISQCQIMPGYAGGRRQFQSSLSSPVLVSGASYFGLTRKQRVTTAGSTTLQQVRSIAEAGLVFSSASLRRPRELGGTLFLPGGILMRDDGARTAWAVCPYYLEVPTGTPGGGGSMTPSMTYSYRAVLRRIDATGRITYSAVSPVYTVTLGGGNTSVTVNVPNPRFPPATLINLENYTIELHRAGPAENGGVVYHRVAETSAVWDFGGDTIAIVDVASDATAEAGALLYSTGNVLENFCPPSCNLFEVAAGRAWLVNAEDTTEIWPSLEYKPGEGIRFNPALAFRVAGDGFGGVTALAAMDGRLILFKSNAIYVVSGGGPDTSGQGQFNPPQDVSRTIGSRNPSSVIAAPDGIMFQATSGGIWLLDRGLGVTYIGKEVEQYTSAASVVDAALNGAGTTVRFAFASGRMLEWDYHHKRWYTHQLRVGASTVVACVNSSTLGWCYALADGTVMVETPGVYSDVNGTSTAIVPRISFPHLNLAGLNGYQRVRGFQVLLDVVGDHTLSLDAEYDYSGAVTGTPRTKALTVATPSAEVEYNPPEGKAKCTSIRPVLTTSVLAAGSGAFRLTGLSLQVAVKRRGTNVPATSRAT